MSFPESPFVNFWNWFQNHRDEEGLQLGAEVKDGCLTQRSASISDIQRQQHIAIIGKTGAGKSSLLRYFMSQDIAANRGFICIDLHGDLIPFILASIAREERRIGKDLSGKLLLLDPADREYAVGLNLLDRKEVLSPALQISEMVGLLKHRWQIDHFGPRTEELLRNSLWVLSENGLTLLELAPLLTNSVYRACLLRCVQNREVKLFFNERYDRASDAMQTVMREAVLNKITAFTVDNAIRHIVGQAETRISLQAAVDKGFWILLNLRKGSLGENALTFAGLFLSKFKNAIFGRVNRNLFTVYADELPNLVATGENFETLLAESRKFAVSVVTANQFLNQFAPPIRSALLSVGLHVCFQLSSEDAPIMARAMGGGEALAKRLRLLDSRHAITKLRELPQEVFIPNVKRPADDAANLVKRSLINFAKPRFQIEDEINARHPNSQNKPSLEGWD
jgi:hypothetical protein